MSMIGVGTATGSAAGDLLGSPSHLNAAASTSRSSPSSGPVTTPAESGDRPAVVVDLSDSSKALLDRAKIAQAVADRLDRHMVVQNGRDHTQVPGSGSDVETAFSAASLSHAEPQTKWEAGSKWGDPTLSDAEFLERAKDFLLSNAADQGWAPEKLQAFRDAVARGTLKFRKASEVPDLNYHTTTTYSDGGMANWTTRSPVGAVKEALDKGEALAFWSADRGNVYVTW